MNEPKDRRRRGRDENLKERQVWPLIASVAAAVDGAACSDRVPALTRCGSSGWRTLDASKPDLLGAS
jgi:hypothetical protein